MTAEDDKRCEIRNLAAELRVLRGGSNRLTLAAAYENLLGLFGQVLTRQSTRHPTESVSLSRNAKGDTQISVEGQAHEDEPLALCAERVALIYDRLAAQYPLNGADKPAAEAAKAARGTARQAAAIATAKGRKKPRARKAGDDA